MPTRKSGSAIPTPDAHDPKPIFPSSRSSIKPAAMIQRPGSSVRHAPSSSSNDPTRPVCITPTSQRHLAVRPSQRPPPPIICSSLPQSPGVILPRAIMPITWATFPATIAHKPTPSPAATMAHRSAMSSSHHEPTATEAHVPTIKN
ncbi:hypothetical protein ACLOJK_004274 [Asimina triloba]